MGTRSAGVCVLILLAGCGGELPSGLDSDAAVDAPPPPPPVIPVVRVHSWPGGGIQLAVEVPAAVAMESPGRLPEAWLETADGARIEAVAENAGVTTGLTALVLVPSADPTIHAQRKAATDALIRALPSGERFALFVARQRAELVADLALPRDEARKRLTTVGGEDAPMAGAALPVREVRELLAEAQSAHGALGRSVVVIGDSVMDDPPEVRRVVQVLTMRVDEDPTAAADAVVAELAARRASLARIGACASLPENAPFKLHLGSGSAELYAPALMTHMAALPCDAADAAADRYPYPSEIDFTFTPEERAVFDQVHAAAQETPFRTSITLGAGTSIAAEAHLRGSGTLFCQRKSFNVALDGERRRLMPGSAADRFFLISMCQDDHYFGQMFGVRLLASLDLFAPSVRYVKVRIDGANRGLYLLMEQPDNALRDNNLGITSVIRRRYDIDGQPAEVKYPDDPVQAAQELAEFEAIGDLARNGPIANLDAELDRVVDLDGYVRLLATMSLLQNGDYIDEPFFYASAELGVEHYRASAWDQDDIYSLCHGGGGRGIVDRCQLTYCAEAELDYALLRSNATYNRFLAQLDGVLDAITPELMTATMASVKDELWTVLDDDETARALTEIGGPTLANAREAIASRMNVMIDAAHRSHASLRTRRAACPAIC